MYMLSFAMSHVGYPYAPPLSFPGILGFVILLSPRT